MISIDAEKTFQKIQHPFIINILSKMEMEGPNFKRVKATHHKPSENFILKELSETLIQYMVAA